MTGPVTPEGQPRMTAPAVKLCIHCERRPAVTVLGLCDRCHGLKRVRRLYRPRARDDPDDAQVQYRRRREAILRRRANLRLPLFPREDLG
jgi:hypothetical protein